MTHRIVATWARVGLEHRAPEEHMRNNFGGMMVKSGIVVSSGMVSHEIDPSHEIDLSMLCYALWVLFVMEVSWGSEHLRQLCSHMN